MSVNAITAPTAQSTLDAILATIRNQETGSPAGNYTSADYGSSGASGAYQFIRSTWQGLTTRFHIGTQYATAAQAPPAVQDAVAAAYVQQILQEQGGQIGEIPLIWYTGNPQGQISAQALAANNGLLPSTYEANWLAEYNKLVGSPGTGSTTGTAGVVNVSGASSDPTLVDMPATLISQSSGAGPQILSSIDKLLNVTGTLSVSLGPFHVGTPIPNPIGTARVVIARIAVVGLGIAVGVAGLILIIGAVGDSDTARKLAQAVPPAGAAAEAASGAGAAAAVVA